MAQYSADGTVALFHYVGDQSSRITALYSDRTICLSVAQETLIIERRGIPAHLHHLAQCGEPMCALDDNVVETGSYETVAGALAIFEASSPMRSRSTMILVMQYRQVAGAS